MRKDLKSRLTETKVSEMQPTRRALLVAGLTAVGTTSALSAPDGASASVATPRTRFDPHDFGAKGDGIADDGPAITAAVTAASTAAKRLGMTIQSTVRLRAGLRYRIASSIRMSSNVRVDMSGALLAGPISGAPVIRAAMRPAGAHDVDAQTAGACFTDHGSGIVSGISFVGGVISGFRYAFCARSTWANPTWSNVSFAYCNVGIFVYQGIQEPKLVSTTSLHDVGVTFIAAATAFCGVNPLAHLDNYFCDGLVYDNTGRNRDSNIIQSAFDEWFRESILRPTEVSATAGGQHVFSRSFPGTALQSPTGRNIYIPSRNNRLIFGFTIRRAASFGCPRGVALLANPYAAHVQDVTAEGMFDAGPHSMLTIILGTDARCTGLFENIDSLYVTNPARAAVEVIDHKGKNRPPDADFQASVIAGRLIGRRHFEGPGTYRVISGAGLRHVTDAVVRAQGYQAADGATIILRDTKAGKSRMAFRVSGRWHYADVRLR